MLAVYTILGVLVRRAELVSATGQKTACPNSHQVEPTWDWCPQCGKPTVRVDIEVPTPAFQRLLAQNGLTFDPAWLGPHEDARLEFSEYRVLSDPSFHARRKDGLPAVLLYDVRRYRSAGRRLNFPGAWLALGACVGFFNSSETKPFAIERDLLARMAPLIHLAAGALGLHGPVNLYQVIYNTDDP